MPAEQRARQGGDVSHRADPQPVLVGGRPELAEVMEPPVHLDPDGREWWETYVPHLAENGLIDRIDVAELEMVASAYATFRAMNRVVAARGYFSPGSVGQVKLAPWIKARDEAITAYARLAERYGLDPLGRVRLGLAVLQGRSLAAEMGAALDGQAAPQYQQVDSGADVGLPPH